MARARWHDAKMSAPGPVIGRRLAIGFAVVGLTALGMCAVLLVLLANVSDTVQEMKMSGESTTRDSLALAMAVREEYIRESEAVIAGEVSAEPSPALAKVEAHAGALRQRVVPSDRVKIDRVVAESRRLSLLFTETIRPALERGDHDEAVRAHGEARVIAVRAMADADALTSLAEVQMAGWHTSAMNASRVGLLTGGAGMLLVIVLSILETRSIRRSVVLPLGELAAAARRVGQGDFDTPRGNVGAGELALVAQAFDSMIEELRARQTRLVRSERLAVIGQLAAGVAHEINNPIGVIRGYLRTVHAGDDPAELREALAIIDDEAATCQRIAEDLLAYARAGEIERANVELGPILEEAGARLVASGEAGAHDVTVDAQPGACVGDARRLRQVVSNLLRNALQLAPKGTPVEVIGAPAAGGGYDFSVLDRGPGVAPEDAERIFEPFYSKRDGGSGLGLAVCDGIVRAHGGSITVRPRAGGGSEFRVTLPPAAPAREDAV